MSPTVTPKRRFTYLNNKDSYHNQLAIFGDLSKRCCIKAVITLLNVFQDVAVPRYNRLEESHFRIFHKFVQRKKKCTQ